MSNTTNYPSIFNDVIGPVMRGPSSSHCAASVRIGRLARDLMDGEITHVKIEFDSGGSLATTHESQGTDMGLFGGFLGWDANDDRLVNSAAALEEAGIHVEIEIKGLDDPHPNTYHLHLKNASESHYMVALSVGGGMIEVIEIDGYPLFAAGDYYETLIYIDRDGHGLYQHLKSQIQGDEINLLTGVQGEMIEIKAQSFPDEGALAQLVTKFPIRSIKRLNPVLPVLSRADIEVPFTTPEEMSAYNHGKNLALWELGLQYESTRAGISHHDAFERMRTIVDIMEGSIRIGLAGTQFADRILGYQSGDFQEAMDNQRLLDGGILNRMILYITAIMEFKSAMEVIVAAPTAGACAGLPGAVIAAAHQGGYSKDDMVRAIFAAGLVGVFIASQATFAAEVGGCQAECGGGSGMAAAALATMAGGTAQQAVNAASMAIQNVLGLICDPVANRVEVPCLGRNVLAASNALSCANMALAGFDPVIPLGEVLDAMDRVGKSLPCELRCTALGGLSITNTSLEIEKDLRIKLSSK